MVAMADILARITGVPHTLDGPYLVCAEPGGEPYIARWDETTLGVRPTEAQMATVGLEIAREQAILAAAAACDAVLAPLASRFSEYETKTWAKQLTEAQALLANPVLPAASYPTIAGITAITGEDVAEFAAAVLKNDEDWTRVTTYCVGMRQKTVAQIKACGTPKEVAAVDVTIRLPG